MDLRDYKKKEGPFFLKNKKLKNEYFRDCPVHTRGVVHVAPSVAFVRYNEKRSNTATVFRTSSSLGYRSGSCDGRFYRFGYGGATADSLRRRLKNGALRRFTSDGVSKRWKIRFNSHGFAPMMPSIFRAMAKKKLFNNLKKWI